VTPPTSEPGVTTPTTGPSVTPPTPEPGMTMPTTGPSVIRPLPTGVPTVPDQSSPTLTSAAVITSSPSGLIMIAEKSRNVSNHGNDKKHKRDKKHENKIRRRDNIHRARRTRSASC
jgi:hypothetical protein